MGMHRKGSSRRSRPLVYIKHTLPSDKQGMQDAKREYKALLKREAAAKKGGRPKGSRKEAE